MSVFEDSIPKSLDEKIQESLILGQAPLIDVFFDSFEKAHMLGCLKDFAKGKKLSVIVEDSSQLEQSKAPLKRTTDSIGPCLDLQQRYINFQFRKFGVTKGVNRVKESAASLLREQQEATSNERTLPETTAV